MKYEKPELIALASAATAVRGGKGEDQPVDIDAKPTTAAYQADE